MARGSCFQEYGTEQPSQSQLAGSEVLAWVQVCDPRDLGSVKEQVARCPRHFGNLTSLEALGWGLGRETLERMPVLVILCGNRMVG
jgi:hypothetical protein